MKNRIVERLREFADVNNHPESGKFLSFEELLEAANEIERNDMRLRTVWEIAERWMNERNEARREVCAHEADTADDQRQYAAQRGWDCFPPSEERVSNSYRMEAP